MFARNADLLLERLGRRASHPPALQCWQSTRTRRWASTASSDEATRYGSTPMSTSRVSAPGRVVGVQGGENQVAGQRGLHGDLRRFLVANFADQHHVRVVAQNRAQPAREGQAGLFGNLDLVDALELIFDRVFDGDDLADRRR